MTLIALRNAFDMSVQAQADYVSGASSATSSNEFYQWLTTGNFVITALSGAGDITVNSAIDPTAGAISGIAAADASDAIIYTVTDLSVSLTSLVSAASAAASHEAYWETLLAGVTDFVNDGSASFKLTGDLIAATAGQTLTTAADNFTLTNSLSSQLFGDAFSVSSGATVNGGADTFTITHAEALRLTFAGDVQTHAGTVNGGNDVVVVKAGLAADSLVSGDVFTSDGTLVGGADKMTFNLHASIATPDYTVAGDAIDALRQVTGGADTIVFKSLDGTEAIVAVGLSGDVANAGTVNSFVAGGNDTIIITDVAIGVIAGDVMNLTAGTVIAGDDKITVNNLLGERIAGDVMSFTGGTLTVGNDTIKGGSGDDEIFGESSTPGFPTVVNTIVNGNGNDIIDGRDGDDIILGQFGNDIITGGLGDDRIDGGSSTDTVTFDTIARAVYVDLNGIAGLFVPFGVGEAMGQGIDDISNVENVTGSSRADTIKGNDLFNALTGLNGDDTLNGRGGADTLTGGLGKDVMNGGSGNDIFDFNDVKEMKVDSALTDVIIGFGSGDKIDLSAIDADTGSAAEAFSSTFVTTLSGAAQISISQAGGNTIISGSTDGDAQAEFTIVLRGTVSLSATDFVL